MILRMIGGSISPEKQSTDKGDGTNNLRSIQNRWGGSIGAGAQAKVDCNIIYISAIYIYIYLYIYIYI